MEADVFIVNFDTLLDKSQWDDALNLILDPVNEDLIILSCIDLVTSLGHRLCNKKLFKEDPEGWCTLQNILDYVVKIAKPKETLISLLELLDHIQTDEFFNSVLKPLKIAFLRLRSKQPESLVWAFNRLYNYIAKIDLCYDEEIQHRYIEDPNEKLLFEHWPSDTRLRIDGLVESLLNFAEPFVSEVKQCKLMESAEQRNAQAMVLVSILMKLLEYPVSHFDVGRAARKTKSDRILLVQRLIAMLFDITPNVYWKLFEWIHRSRFILTSRLFDESEAENFKISPVSLGVLSAFVYPYQICLGQLPCVHSFEFIVDSLMPYAVALLVDENSSSGNYRKLGLKLCKFFLKLLRNIEVPCYKLETPFEYRSLVLGLIKTTSFSCSPSLRQKSFERFMDFVRAFDSSGQLMLIRWIFRFVVAEEEYEDDDDEERMEKSSANVGELVLSPYACAGIRGHVIDFFRSRLRAELEARKSDKTNRTAATEADKSENDYFKPCLPEMFSLFTMLKGGLEIGLLQYFEQIMATLNLLRFVCISGSKVGGHLLVLDKGWLQNIENVFLASLNRSLDVARSHYDTDIRKSLSEDTKAKTFFNETAALKKELCTLTLMQHLLARVNELVRCSIAEK